MSPKNLVAFLPQKATVLRYSNNSTGIAFLHQKAG